MKTEQISGSEVISDRYAVRSILGHGASATVYLADDLERQQPVVVKVLSDPGGANPENAIARFRGEVAATRRLDHKNIINVLDDGVTADHRPYFVSEWIKGRSLAAVLREAGHLSRGHAVDVALAIAGALAYVHERGLVHRDLKPSNIFIPGWPEAPDFPNAKLLDFGVAGRLEQGRTQVGMIFGTLGYMSPEQVKGDEQSAATDVYGFGLVLFEMLKGHAPSNRTQDLASLLIAIRDGIPEKEMAGIEPDLAELVRQCVCSNPAERPAMAEVLSRLERSQSISGENSDEMLLRPVPPAPAAGAPPASPLLTERTLILDEPGSAPRASMGSSRAEQGEAVLAVPQSGRWKFWMALAMACAVISIGAILYFQPTRSLNAPPGVAAPPNAKTTAPEAASAPPVRSHETALRAVRFAAGLLLMGASISIGFWLRAWLGSRSQVKDQAYELVFGARARTDLTATIALQLEDLVSKLHRLDERILAGTVALMLNEYGSATDAKDRQAALMNVVALSEKLAVRLSPWYERYKEIIASAVAVMGSVSGLMTAINSVLGHKH